jgi:DNA integrity scanning protein DisA with diadenylate cyclase activity
MNIKLKFNIKYLYLFSLLFLIELIIALFIQDRFVRPFLGDVLVVILLYFFIRIFIETEKFKIVLAVFIFACLIEMGQYFNLVSILNLQDIRIARIVIGSTFDVMDLFAYFVGAVLLMLPAGGQDFLRLPEKENDDRN